VDADLAEMRIQAGDVVGAKQVVEKSKAGLWEVVTAHGLLEIEREPELHSIYLPGVLPLVRVLMQDGELAMVLGNPSEALTGLKRGMELLKYTRSLPQLFHRLALLLARATRLVNAQGATGGALDKAVAECDGLLEQCLSVAVLEGGHDHNVIVQALVEQALLRTLQANDVTGRPEMPPTEEPAEGAEPPLVSVSAAVSACSQYLDAAAKACSMRLNLTHKPHTFSAAISPTAALPQWIKDAIQAQEAYQEQSRGKAPGGDLPEGRVLMEELMNLRRKQNQRPLHSDCVLAQLGSLHNIMKDVCPPYAAEACFPSPPTVSLESTLTPAPIGTVSIQWLESEVYAESTDPKVKLDPLQSMASVVYVVVSESAPDSDGNTAPEVACGVKTLRLEIVRDIHSAIRMCSADLEGAANDPDADLADMVEAAEELVIETAAQIRGLGGTEAAEALGLNHPTLDMGMDTSQTLMEDDEETDEPKKSFVDTEFVKRLELMMDSNSGISTVDAELAKHVRKIFHV